MKIERREGVIYKCLNPECNITFREVDAKEAWDDITYDDKNHLICPECGTYDIEEIKIESSRSGVIRKSVFGEEINLHIDYESLEVFYKYCYNRVNYDIFKNIMVDIYFNESYVESLWEDYKDNIVGFIISRNEKVFFNRIKRMINEENYKG